MAKEKTDKQQAGDEGTHPVLPGTERWVRVRVLRGISLGGMAFRPTLDGTTIVPTEAIIPAAEAARHAADYIEVIEDVERPADGKPTVVA